jgi:hypothetical protein
VVEELVEAVKRVSMGRKYISSFLAEKMIDFDNNIEKSLHQALPDREFEVMCLLLPEKVVPASPKSYISAALLSVHTGPVF